jgi:hypothetical protein
MAIKDANTKLDYVSNQCEPTVKEYLCTAKMYVKPRWELEDFTNKYPDLMVGTTDRYKLVILSRIFNKLLPIWNDTPTSSGRKCRGRTYYNIFSNKHIQFEEMI